VKPFHLSRQTVLPFTRNVRRYSPALKYKPGIVTGGRRIQHDCGASRGMGYFLEVGLCTLNAVDA
jgi:RNA 3'-terminal phosphate cyclase